MTTLRDHLELAAASGNVLARAHLDGPECPPVLRYLRDWLYQLHGRSGFTISGYAPMTWATLDAWSRMTGNVPDQEDIAALFMLDAIMLNPGKME